MHQQSRSHIFSFSVHDVFRWHVIKNVYGNITPPWTELSFKGGDRHECVKGSHLFFSYRHLFMHHTWVLEVTSFIPDQEIVLTQVQGPFKSWQHKIVFSSGDEGSMKLSETIIYDGGPLTYRPFKPLFTHFLKFKHAILERDLTLIKRYPLKRPLRILMTGSHGMIGSAFRDFLTVAGHEVIPAVRVLQKHRKGVYWDTHTGVLNCPPDTHFDGVIHLAGRNVGKHLWTKKEKGALFKSRVETTMRLVEGLMQLRNMPNFFLSASATGYYGSCGGNKVTEDAPPCSHSFLGDICRHWEDAARPLAGRGTRLMHARFGVVLSSKGGALKKMLPAFRLGLGGRLGSGDQYMSWITLDDLIGGMYHLVMTPTLSGPFNFTTPYPVTNKAFTEALAHQLHRPSLFPVPAWVIRLLLRSQGNELLLTSLKAVPSRLLESDYDFFYPKITKALDHLL